jgi:hypothetical protein
MWPETPRINLPAVYANIKERFLTPVLPLSVKKTISRTYFRNMNTPHGVMGLI